MRGKMEKINVPSPNTIISAGVTKARAPVSVWLVAGPHVGQERGHTLLQRRHLLRVPPRHVRLLARVPRQVVQQRHVLVPPVHLTQKYFVNGNKKYLMESRTTNLPRCPQNSFHLFTLMAN